MLLGLLINLFALKYEIAPIIPLWYFLFPLPAVFDFTAHELNLWRSNNYIRLLTGIFLGCSAGFSLFYIVNFHSLIGFVMAAWLVVLEFIVAFILSHYDGLQGFIERYEKAVIKD